MDGLVTERREGEPASGGHPISIGRVEGWPGGGAEGPGLPWNECHGVAVETGSIGCHGARLPLH